MESEEPNLSPHPHWLPACLSILLWNGICVILAVLQLCTSTWAHLNVSEDNVNCSYWHASNQQNQTTGSWSLSKLIGPKEAFSVWHTQFALVPFYFQSDAWPAFGQSVYCPQHLRTTLEVEYVLLFCMSSVDDHFYVPGQRWSSTGHVVLSVLIHISLSTLGCGEIAYAWFRYTCLYGAWTMVAASSSSNL